MTRPRRFLLRMIAFLLGTLVVTGVLLGPIAQAFMANPVLNSLILAVLLIGIAYVFRQVLMLGTQVDWLETYQRGAKSSAVHVPPPPSMLAAMATLLENRSRSTLSAPATRTLLDTIGARLEEGREISRYLIGLMVFLGLLGTFWGLLQTVSAVGDTIRNLNVGASGDFVQMFEGLRRGLESPLTGMGTAFSSSLLGLSGSLVLGFLDLQAGQAQNRFYNELEDWLSGMTRLSSGALIEGDQSVPAYVQALLEQTAESLDNLQRIMARAEENRSGSSQALMQLSERLATLTDQMRSEQGLLVKLAEHQMELRPLLTRLASQGETGGLDQASRAHLRNLDVYVGRLLEETAEGRNRLSEELRSEIKLLARTIAAAADAARR